MVVGQRKETTEFKFERVGAPPPRTWALTKPNTSPFGLTGGPEGPEHSAAEAQGQGGEAAAPASAETSGRRRRRRRRGRAEVKDAIVGLFCRGRERSVMFE